MKRLLLVEDSRGVRQYLQHHLSPHFDIECAEDGLEGLELARTEAFDLVLSDINLPKMDGFALHSAIVAEFPYQAVALMTDADIDGYLSRALASGIGHIIAKPAFKFDLIGTIQLLHDLEQGQLFGMDRRLGPGGEVRTFVLSNEADLPQVMTQCYRLLDRFPRKDAYHKLFPELVRNALFHGRRPCGLEGAGDYLLLSVGADWHRVGFGVCDRGGNLTRAAALEHLIQPGGLDPELHRGGKGLLLSRHLMDLTFVNLQPGLQTEILCFDLLQGYRGNHSLHIHEQ